MLYRDLQGQCRHVVGTTTDLFREAETPLQRLAMTGGRGASTDHQRIKLVSDVDMVEIGLMDKIRSFMLRLVS